MLLPLGFHEFMESCLVNSIRERRRAEHSMDLMKDNSYMVGGRHEGNPALRVKVDVKVAGLQNQVNIIT